MKYFIDLAVWLACCLILYAVFHESLGRNTAALAAVAYTEWRTYADNSKMLDA